MLSSEQLQHFQSQGYILVPSLFDTAQLANLSARFEQFATGEVAPANAMKLMRDIMVVKGAVEAQSPLHGINKLINFEADASLYQYVLQENLLSCVRKLLGDEIYSVSTNVFNKPPGVDGRHPFHQDLRYFRIRPADKIVGAWTAMFPATRESGCLAVIPGSHKGDLLEHDNPEWEYVNAGFFAAQGVDLETRAYVEMAPGDTLLFHPLLLHGSGHNRSSHFRRAISAHFASADCESSVREWREGKQVRHIPR